MMLLLVRSGGRGMASQLMYIDGYKWFGKLRNNQTCLKGEGGVGFLVRECLVDEVEFIH